MVSIPASNDFGLAQFKKVSCDQMDETDTANNQDLNSVTLPKIILKSSTTNKFTFDGQTWVLLEPQCEADACYSAKGAVDYERASLPRSDAQSTGNEAETGLDTALAQRHPLSPRLGRSLAPSQSKLSQPEKINKRQIDNPVKRPDGDGMWPTSFDSDEEYDYNDENKSWPSDILSSDHTSHHENEDYDYEDRRWRIQLEPRPKDYVAAKAPLWKRLAMTPEELREMFLTRSSRQYYELYKAVPAERDPTNSAVQFDETAFFWILRRQVPGNIDIRMWNKVRQDFLSDHVGYVVSPAIFFGLWESLCRFTPHFGWEYRARDLSRERHAADEWRSLWVWQEDLVKSFRRILNSAENLFTGDLRIADLKQRLLIEGGDWTISEALKDAKPNMLPDAHGRVTVAKGTTEEPERSPPEVRDDTSNKDNHNESTSNDDTLDGVNDQSTGSADQTQPGTLEVSFVNKYDWKTMTKSECRAVLSLMRAQQAQYVATIGQINQTVRNHHDDADGGSVWDSYDYGYGPEETDYLEAFEYGVEGFKFTMRVLELALQPGGVVFSS
ncbi:MAG: hypothetical protein M1831_007168 [Alyxoria varia]|nr:MAG: hypothetical protein M1831_007168 [Alyxoria varia]